MISTLIKALMEHFQLTQAELANVMEVKLQRVRDLSAGRAKNLTREEGEALIRKLNVSGDWLATGHPPMFRSDTEQKAATVMDQLGNAAQVARTLGLSAEQGRVVMELLFFAQTGHAGQVRRALADLAGLSADEAELLSNYRNASKAQQDILKATSAMFRADQ